jgi:3-deoxy-7-phosphoheptulonate synthase
MLVVMETNATEQMVADICQIVESMGLKAHTMPGSLRTAIGITGNKSRINSDKIISMPGVKNVIHVTQPYKLVSREFYPDDTVVDIDGVKIGADKFMVMAGPCSVESREQCMKIAKEVAKAGVQIFRGGAFKPRTSPYSFQGLKEDGLKILAEVREKFGLKIVTEAVDTDTIDIVAKYADIIQIGARNMQNFSLLRKAGRIKKPVLLKRGMSATVEEFLMAAEYIMAENNPNVILCERGVRTFGNHSRNTLDLSAIPYVKKTSHLPIISDPSHSTGDRDKVLPLSRASIAVGADGLIVEVHHEPSNALSDGPQAITPEMLHELMRQIKPIGDIMGKDC